jgi:NADH dehydrogenase [ubiquinone] 1 alpha subcomplex assembly factor 6
MIYIIQRLWQLCYSKDMSDNYCQTLVRTQDPDRYLISIFYAPEIRQHLWSLYAFNHEIAKTREVVTDTHIGLIRLQWWRDALAGLYERNAVLKQDVIEGLAEAVWRYNLSRELFDHLIYAREFDLEDRAPGSLEGLCNYADYTHTPLLRLGATIAGEDPDQPGLQPVAMAYALTGILRAAPFHKAQGRVYIPENITAAAVRVRAQELLQQSTGSKESKLIRLHRKISEQYLNRIKALGDNTDDFRLSIPPFFREIPLWWTTRA